MLLLSPQALFRVARRNASLRMVSFLCLTLLSHFFNSSFQCCTNISISNLAQMLMVWKEMFCLQQMKTAEQKQFLRPNKTVFESQTGARGGKKCSPVKIENVVPYTWLLLLLNLRACWILDNADPGYCRGATDFSWQSIHTLARDHRECGRQYPVTSTGYLHSCSSLGPYFRVE